MIAHENQIVTLFETKDLSWSFDGQDPSFYVAHANNYGRHEKVYPTPAYHHDIDLVRAEFSRLRELAPLPFPLLVAVFSHEFHGRTNGFYNEHAHYNYETSKADYHIGTICLSGKVIPLHPAMTRYLVSHEYGHGVEDQLQRIRGMKDFALRRYYVEHVRPDALDSYGPGKWHSNVGELMANDFRILVAGREPEFWPHPGFSRPEHTPSVVTFWQDAQKDLLNAEKNIDVV